MFGLTITGELVVAIVGALVAITGISIGKQERLDARIQKLEWSLAYKLGGDAERMVGPESERTSSSSDQPRRFQYVPGLLVAVGIVLFIISTILFNERLSETIHSTDAINEEIAVLNGRLSSFHDIRFVTAKIIARTPDQEKLNWWDDYRVLIAHKTNSTSYLLRKSLPCGKGYEAVAAWHELIRVGEANPDAMRHVNASVTEDGIAQISLWAREGKDGEVPGWAQIDVAAVCRSIEAVGQEDY